MSGRELLMRSVFDKLPPARHDAMIPILTLHHPARSKQYYDAGYWQEQTLYSLLHRNAQTRGSGNALRDSARRLSWAELLYHVDELAAQFSTSGLRAGDRVSIWLPNRVEAIIVTLACSRNGYVCNPSLHQSYTVTDVIELLKRTTSRALIAQRGAGADARRSDVFAQVSAEVGSLKCVLELDPIGPGVRFGQAPAADRTIDPPVDDPDKVVLLAFTSGTTGNPKGVMHSDNTILANARAMAREWGHHEEMVLLCLSPMTHAIGTIAMAQSLVSGFELVLNDVPKGATIMDWLLQSGATYVMGVPTHAIDLLAEAEKRQIDGLGKVSIFYMGGAAISHETITALIARGITPQNVYGMTENSAHHYTRPYDALNTMVESCGRDCGCYEVKIWDPADADAELAQGEVGEIGGRGACLMLGYFGDQGATESAINRFGWFMSGDLGRIDERGNLQIIGRKKDIIIRGGRNIYPSRIEDAARSHPAVLKVAAFPMADKRLGEKVAIAVVLREGKTLLAQDLLAHLDRNGISRYDMPEFFSVLDAMPMTPSGKLFKRGFIEQVRTGELKPEAVRWSK